MAVRESMDAEELASIVERKRLRSTEDEIDAMLQNDQLMKRRFGQRICSFFSQGKCTRGEHCPYRHVTAEEAEEERRQNRSAQSSIKDQYAAGATIHQTVKSTNHRDVAPLAIEAKKAEGKGNTNEKAQAEAKKAEAQKGFDFSWMASLE